jgi:hypothetical protein
MLLRRGVNRHQIDTTADKDLVSKIWRELGARVSKSADLRHPCTPFRPPPRPLLAHVLLGRLDDAYTALPDFSDMLVSYIREQPDEFVFEPPRRSLRLAELSRTILMVLAAMLGVPVLIFALVLGVLALRRQSRNDSFAISAK